MDTDEPAAARPVLPPYYKAREKQEQYRLAVTQKVVGDICVKCGLDGNGDEVGAPRFVVQGGSPTESSAGRGMSRLTADSLPAPRTSTVHARWGSALATALRTGQFSPLPCPPLFLPRSLSCAATLAAAAAPTCAGAAPPTPGRTWRS